jgi:YqaJ-like viral recombinase domain
MIIVTETQRDAAWLHARAQCATASRFKDIIARTKSRPAARRNYLVEVATSRMTGQAPQNFVSTAMRWGTDQEPAAKIVYAQQFDVEIDETGFVRHDSLMAGASPDGLVDWDGLLEVKCPFSSAVHIQTWMEGMPAEHMAQIQGQLWITGRAWCDFASFDPRLSDGLQLYVQRIHRDEDYITNLEHEVRLFLGEVDGLVATLMAKSQRDTNRSHRNMEPTA